ncbi:elastase-like serine protease [Catenaria anguillulae PL171]|uniref:Elastase-like serine protease n=1 Tax=Catenaria anguillulae PL171 TaxID=765915 RepID=A0A1Y2HT78_9FUNG|nr:elastase-like serine protease [Catenaria anguillulae PL171]
MKSLILFFALINLIAAAPTSADNSANKFIVTLKPTAKTTTFARSLHAEIQRESVQTRSIASAITHEYSIGDSFTGFAGTFSPALVARLRTNPNVALVEPDLPVYAMGVQTNASWALTRISQRARQLPGPYVYPDSAGSGVSVYVLDTGVQATHPDLEGRVKYGWKANAAWNDEDVLGHGTHVAGVIASKTYGVAKKSSIVSVKVLGDNGAGSTSNVLAGLQFVTQQARAAGRTVVANLSIGGGKTQALNDAVATAVRAGVVVTAAAGNDNSDACNFSPASEPLALTVAALDSVEDKLTTVTNFGRCVDVVAPGSKIVSTFPPSREYMLQGTSRAAPHVAGAAALILGEQPNLTPAQVAQRVVDRSTKGLLTGNLRGTPNRILYTL